MGCGGASPTPQLQYQVLDSTSSGDKGRQSLPVNELTPGICDFYGISLKWLHNSSGASQQKKKTICIEGEFMRT